LCVVLPPLAKRFLAYSPNDTLVALTGLVVLWYTCETREMRREMATASTRAETPEVSLRLDQLTSGFFDLVLENTSQVPAYQVRFTEIPDLPLSARFRTGEIGFLKDGVAYLAPGQQYRSFFLNFPALTGSDRSRSTVRFQYAYESGAGRRVSRTVEINLELFWGVMKLGADFRSVALERLTELRDAVRELRRS